VNIKNRIVIITGSADRVGKITAIQLAKAGAHLVVHYHKNREKAIETANLIKKIGNKVIVVNGDISKEDTWYKIKNKILQEFGRIDVLINNAAIFYKTPFLKSNLQDWDNFMNINLKGVYLGCKIMGESMFAQKSGIIINIADVSAEKIWSSYIPYCVSKAGVIALTKGIAKALAPHVLVNCIAPGTVLLAEN
jgi:NAD(P)-dependent dehydrogenase (short-subunit alcohol dehydrogenase family)